MRSLSTRSDFTCQEEELEAKSKENEQLKSTVKPQLSTPVAKLFAAVGLYYGNENNDDGSTNNDDADDEINNEDKDNIDK